MNGLNTLLQKLIRSGVGRKRFVVAVTGLSFAILLILAAVQIQVNYHDLLNSKNNRDSIANFLVINKTLTDQNLGATALSDTDIDDLKKQSFVETVGLLTPSRFKASIQSASDRFPFYTDIAFEAVPDEFIDVTSKDWGWDQTKQYVPIIVPNMFLDFYNFQFSFSQNLPQLTQQVVKMIVFKINVYGDKGMSIFYGRVVGFSDRISSILVPQGFMDWANTKFGNNRQTQPSRVIIRTNDPGNPLLTNYLKEKKLATDADKTRFSRYRQVVQMVVNISWITGTVMLVFAMLIFTLFIQLTIASCKEEVILLVTLGASPVQLKKFLVRQFFPVTVIITFAALVLLCGLQFFLAMVLERQHVYVRPLIAIVTLISAGVVLAIIGMVITRSVHKYVSAAHKK